MQDTNAGSNAPFRPEVAAAQPMSPGDDAPVGTPGTGENVCPHCRGSGRDGSETCPVCDGSGKVNVGVGGG